MPKDAAVFNKSKPKGVVNFYPFERLDEASLSQVRKFQVYPLGKIQEYSRHIPYNSGKKDFYEKTGRESFEVFQYVFRVPGDDAEYAVMWDYNVGLVRMTPFFKCCKYPKTTPAKMLNSNPGLKEITHSITGGSIMAQGYWMPYHCAKAVCATFCHNIAGALIPIFGPDFPSLCTPAEAPEYSRMIIDPAVVIQSTREADHFRRLYSNMVTSGSNNGNSNGNLSPKRDRRVFRSQYDDSGSGSSRHHPRHNHRIRKPFICDSPYATDTDGEISPATGRGSMGREQHRFMYSPITSVAPLRPSNGGGGWTPANQPPHPLPLALPPPHPHPHGHSHSHSHYETPGPSPWLSAVPRFTTTAHLPPPYPSPHAQPQSHYPHPHPNTHSHPHAHSQTQPHPHPHSHSQSHPRLRPHPLPPPLPQPWRAKRPAEHIDPDYEYDSHSHSQRSQHTAAATTSFSRPSSASKATTTTATLSPLDDKRTDAAGASALGADKKAALLLMNLSVRDSLGMGKGKAREGGVGGGAGGGGGGGSMGGMGGLGGIAGGGGGLANGMTTPETTSPRDGAFPRIKRIRSNSM
ncbi:Uu.00g049940.m01.CDS01 [Anthostomella pinea]|uniref:Uu.00g049940.m01.CDS01 n=1 Tax=Anthostomella pinea TaxID=933095 RepID=A0AAI8YER4_9PEZI|nr:Uu.00g049940.m01.CDS01 [Anthostomella pinea]